MPYLLLLIVCIVIIAVYNKLMKDRDYTAGKGMFKNSEHFIDENEDKQKDASDFDYWNKNQMK
ncbi:MAG: hypothetical protein ACI4M3_01315 [Acutalibacteraceae bacterium]